MNKIEIQQQGTATVLNIKLNKKQEVSMREYDIIRKQIHRPLIPVFFDGVSLKYDITGMYPLNQIIYQGCSVKLFFNIMIGIVRAFRLIREGYLFLNNLVLDTQNIYFNSANGELYFIYIPILRYDNVNDEKKFLENLLRTACFAPGENTSYVVSCYQYLQNMTIFSLYDVENYMDGLRTQMNTAGMQMKKCKICGTEKELNARFCSRCGAEFSREYSVTGVVQPYLRNLHTGEVVKLDKLPFSIGHELAFVDYCILNNKISHNHATIIFQDGIYYVKDNNSTNGTFLNGQQLKPNNEYRMDHGHYLQLADIEFIFEIK